MIDESKIDFENLTKEEALYLHRKLWATIAELTYKLQRPISKEYVLELYHWPCARWHCWCCEYVAQKDAVCVRCPVYWGKYIDDNCQSFGSPYTKWFYLKRKYEWYAYKECSKADLWKMIRCARKIALLPERED